MAKEPKTYGKFKDENGVIWQAITDFEYNYTDNHFLDEEDDRFEGERYKSFPADIYGAKAVPLFWNKPDEKVPVRFVEKIVLTTGVDEEEEEIEPDHDDDFNTTTLCYIQNENGDMDCGEVIYE